MNNQAPTRVCKPIQAQNFGQTTFSCGTKECTMSYGANPNVCCQQLGACKRRKVIGYTYLVACGVQYILTGSLVCLLYTDRSSLFLYQTDYATCHTWRNEKMVRAVAQNNGTGFNGKTI